jgi:2,4-dienoyl-CoA reductase-like NADH-dependent reductase (Old Yellow Enzyme family)
MDDTDIEDVQAAFTAGASRALEAGFEVLEIHSAHGYLLNSFLSPLSNQRRDRYGGPFENRIRFLLETVRRVRSVWLESNPLFVRLSCTDWIEGGWTIEDTVSLAKLLKGEGVDLIDCSSGGITPDSNPRSKAGYQLPFAERVKGEAGILSAAVGMITEAKQADGIIRSGKADMVLLGRELLRNPYWPLHAAKSLGIQDVPRPDQYFRVF